MKDKRQKPKKVPTVLQMEALECGAASLAMILAYYGRWVPLEKLRADCGVSRNGAKASSILKAARSYGLDARGGKYSAELLKQKNEFPCIIHWNFSHFVVLCGFSRTKAVINDPANGTRTVPMKEFEESFTGICLFFSPNGDFIKEGHPKSGYAYIKNRLPGQKRLLTLILTAALCLAIAGVFGVLLSRVFLDELLPGNDKEADLRFLLLLSLLTLLQIVLLCVNAVLVKKAEGRLATKENSEYIWRIMRKPMVFFAQRMTGDLHQRQTSIDSMSNMIFSVMVPLFADLISSVFYMLIMLHYSLPLALIGIFSLLVNLITSRQIARYRLNISRALSRDKGRLAACTSAGMGTLETIKAGGAERLFFEKWAGFYAAANSKEVQFMRSELYFSSVPGCIRGVTNALVLCVGTLLCMKGQFTPGLVLAFQSLLQQFMAPAQTYFSAGQALMEMRTNTERLEDVLDAEEDADTETENAEAAELRKLSGDIELRDLVFGYAKVDEPLLKGLNLTIKQGSSVAVVGRSGCGKSTLSRLISGLYTPWSGEILIGGQELFSIDRNIRKSSIGVIDQNITLFEDSVANNIKMWDSTIEDFEMILAGRDADIHEDIMALPGGYGHKLLENGKNLSGGQRQRMEIARVLAQDPTILILDEATSALDAITEKKIVEHIRERGITCIVIAHRLSTVRDCDEIVVLDHGEIVQRGTHKQLIAEQGLYADLVAAE